jgi:GNAT superfamily N-acetyltransferase
MIRVGTINDFEAIDAFDPFGGSRLEALSLGQSFVAEIDGEVAGFIFYRPNGFIGRPFIDYLAIHPGYRRQGIALKLLRKVEDRVGEGRLFISTGDTNQAMKLLLQHDGWTAAGCVQGVNLDGTAECFYYRNA